MIQLWNPNDEYLYPTEFLNQINISGMLRHLLKLKLGAVVLLLRNLDPRNGACNGTRLKIIELSDNLIIRVILTGSHLGDTFVIPRISLIPSDSRIPFEFNRHQLSS